MSTWYVVPPTFKVVGGDVKETASGAVYDSLVGLMEHKPAGNMAYTFVPMQRRFIPLLNREVACHLWLVEWPGASAAGTGMPNHLVAGYELDIDSPAMALQLIRRMKLLELQNRLGAGIAELEDELEGLNKAREEIGHRVWDERRALWKVEEMLK